MDFDLFAEDIEIRKIGLHAVVLGVSGAGKSFLMGSYPGKVLHLVGRQETHGVAQSKKCSEAHPNNTIVSARWDKLSGKTLDADFALEHLINNLLNAEVLKKAGIQCVCIDGLTEIEQLIMQSEAFRSRCRTKKGDIDGFKTKEAVLTVFRPILDRLADLYNDHNIDVVCTGILEVQEVSNIGEILESQPVLTQYGIAKTIVMTFPDILPIGQMMGKSGKLSRRFQFQAKITSTSKDASGRVKKFHDFTPRVAGFDSYETPRTLPGDLSDLLAKKAEGSLVPKQQVEETMNVLSTESDSD